MNFDCALERKHAYDVIEMVGKKSNFSRAYLKHLFDSNEILGQILATAHNIAFYKSLADRAREAILQDRFLEFKEEFLRGYLKDDGNKAKGKSKKRN